MKCFVNGQQLPCRCLARREMNFNQPFPAPATAVTYEIAVEIGEFLEQIREVYEQYAHDERADLPFHEAGKNTILDRWRQLAYPPIDQLLAREPAVLEGLVKDWFGQEALDRLIPGPEQGLPRFLVNTIDHVTIENGYVRIEGKAHPHPMLVQAC